MNDLKYETLENGIKVFVAQNIKFGRDALILANFAPVKSTSRLLDIGAGCGIISLAIRDKNPGVSVVAIDINNDAHRLIETAIKHNGLNNFTAEHTDLKTYNTTKKFDIAVCNPPYFSLESGTPSADRAARCARHEISCTVGDVAACARRSLKQGGSLCISYRPERVVDALYQLRNAGLEPKRMRFVKQRPENEPWLVVIDARLDRGIGLDILPDLIINNCQRSTP